MNVVVGLGTYYSKKEIIDDALATKVFKEKSNEYFILEGQIERFLKIYTNFVKKYNKYLKNFPDTQVITNVKSLQNVIHAMNHSEEKKPTILTPEYLKVAGISEMLKHLCERISGVSDKMTEANMLRDRKVERVQNLQYEDIADHPSITENLDKIVSYLQDDDKKSIGILGPIGVGKTTLMRRLNHELKRHHFDFVIWIDANDNTIENIQDAIIGRLKLEVPKDTGNIKGNAIIISKALCNEKYILLIDQVTSKIMLNEVGIDEHHKSGKLVVASSSRKIICGMTDQHEELKYLSKDDALKLFESVCGRIHDRRIKHIADCILNSCRGWPLLIKLVANRLKREIDEDVWRRVKTELQSDTEFNTTELAAVEHAYKMAYDKLRESHKKCLLFVTLFPRDHVIHKDYLVECWNAEEFLDTYKPKCIRKTREHGATTLKELTDDYLLENYSESDKKVKMQVYLRKVAIKQHFPGEEEWLSWHNQHNLIDEVTWRRTKRLSLIGCETQLPASPECHDISTLLMKKLCIPENPDLVLGDQFFDNMLNLGILDLNETKIRSLPNYTTSLVSLKCLYLNGCLLLTELPNEVKNLKELEFLDIRETSIRSLPNELGDVTQLRCLRISFSQTKCNHYGENSEVKTEIPFGIIHRLQQLEELTIEVGCCNTAWDNIADGLATEIAALEKLSTLDFHFPRVRSLQKFVDSSQSLKKEHYFRSFNISIGCCEMEHTYGLNIPGILADRKLRLSTKQIEELLNQEEISSIGKVLIQASSFELFGDAVRNLSEFSLENLGSLKVFVVGRSKKMKSIVDVSSHDNVLQCLEKLHLFKLTLLEQIWAGEISSGSLAYLKVLTLSGCPQITTILNCELAKALSSLEYVKVEDCDEVKQIISEDTTPGDVAQFEFLNKVMTIKLVKLPKLSTFCTVSLLKLKSLIKIEIRECDVFDLSNLSKVENIIDKIKADPSWISQFDMSSKEEDLSTGGTHEVGESSKQRGSD